MSLTHTPVKDTHKKLGRENCWPRSRDRAYVTTRQSWFAAPYRSSPCASRDAFVFQRSPPRKARHIAVRRYDGGICRCARAGEPLPRPAPTIYAGLCAVADESPPRAPETLISRVADAIFVEASFGGGQLRVRKQDTAPPYWAYSASCLARPVCREEPGMRRIRGDEDEVSTIRLRVI